MQKDQVQVDQTPWIILTVTNITDQNLSFPSGAHAYRVFVEGKRGEPDRTEYHRHIRGDFSPGDGPDLSSGPVSSYELMPGMSGVRKLDLAKYYSMKIPGQYKVYVEVRDEHEKWIRSNTVMLEVILSTQ